MNPIEPGQKTKRIAIQSPTKTVNGLGEEIASWPGTTIARRWAKVETLQGRELSIAQQQVANVTHRLTFDFCPDLTTLNRIVLGSHVFGVEFVNDRDFAGVEHVVLVKENP